MRYCDRCSKQLPDEAVYCNQCGKQISPCIVDMKFASKTVSTSVGNRIVPKTKVEMLKNWLDKKKIYLIVGGITLSIFIWLASANVKKVEPVVGQSVLSQGNASQESLKNKPNVSVEAFINCLENKDIKGAKVLLELGLSPNSKTTQGASLLELACSGNNYQIVNLLIEKGADVNAQNGKGVTPLMIASSAGFAETVYFILSSKDINIDIVDYQGRTAWQWAEFTKNSWMEQGLNTFGQEAVISLFQNYYASSMRFKDCVVQDGKIGFFSPGMSVSSLYKIVDSMFIVRKNDLVTIHTSRKYGPPIICLLQNKTDIVRMVYTENPMFRTEKGLGVASMLGDIRANYSISKIYFLEGFFYVEVGELNTTFKIMSPDQQRMREWIKSPNSLPDHARVVEVIVEDKKARS